MTIRFRKSGTVLAAAITSLAAVAVLPFGSGSAQAAPACPTSTTTTLSKTATASALRNSCSQAQFDRLFRGADVGALPIGVYDGGTRPVGRPDSGASAAASSIWAGKTFHRGWLTNRAFGGEILPADVFYARSTIDGKRVIRIDYRRSGLGVGHDELRRLSNGVYLGYGFLGNTKSVDFWVWR